MQLLKHGALDSPSLGVIPQNPYKRVFLDAVGVTAENVFYPAVFFGIPEIEGDSVGQPVVLKALDSYELFVSGWFKFHQLTVECNSTRSDTDPHRTSINSGYPYPGSRKVIPSRIFAGVLNAHLAGH